MSAAYPPPQRQALRETCEEMLVRSTREREEAKLVLDDATSKLKENLKQMDNIQKLRKSERAWETLSFGTLCITFFIGAATATASLAMLRFWGVLE